MYIFISNMMFAVQGFIDEEIKNGIAPEKIVVGGFSQGTLRCDLYVHNINLIAFRRGCFYLHGVPKPSHTRRCASIECLRAILS